MNLRTPLRFALVALAAGCGWPGTPPFSLTLGNAVDSVDPSAPPQAPPLPATSAPLPAPASSIAGGCPDEMAPVDRFCIDRYEAHLVERESGARHPHFLRPDPAVAYLARSQPAVFPQGYISRVESQAACEAANKRLCSRQEWQRACRGSAGTTQPYGPRWVRGRCNDGKTHLLTLRFGADPTRWRYAQFNDPDLAQEPGFLALTGTYEGCVGAAGVYDLVGNLHEWVSDTADTAFKARIDNDGVSRSFQYWSAGNAVFMGGFFSTRGELGPGCTFTTVAHDATYHDYSTGFRCCADVAL